MSEHWNIKESNNLYDVSSWSGGYFNINNKGHLNVEIPGSDKSLDLKNLVTDLKARGLRTPLLLRFTDIVKSRIDHLQIAFQQSNDRFDFKGDYRGVFPIKVNHQRHLVEEIVKHGSDYSLGLEVGSKPELLVSLALLPADDHSLVICNGFKDEDYVDMALLGRKLGKNCIIVVDQFSEIELIYQRAKKLDITPRIGFRMKLEAKGSGKWVESSGMSSKYGLSSGEILKGIQWLKDHDCLNNLELLHFHIGSQVSSIRSIKDSLVEACRVYVEVSKLGAELRYFDVGGGLGIDYDGTQTNWDNSVNYSLQEYANEVVSHIAQMCNDNNFKHPAIVTEAGRALVAHHSVLVFDIVGTNNQQSKHFYEDYLKELSQNKKEEQSCIQDMATAIVNLKANNLHESIHNVFQAKDEAVKLFNLGYLDLNERAVIDELFAQFAKKAIIVAQKVKRKPEEMAFLQKIVTVNYYSNFSLFQSAPDIWAVDQLFPIMPIHRLNERPTEKAILFDLTCDSDGKINQFISPREIKNNIDLHVVNDNEPYYLGIFLIGAYQETLGDFHNLFGDTDAVHVVLKEKGYEIKDFVEGDTVTQVLEYVEYDRSSLLRQLRKNLEIALDKGCISLKETKDFIRRYEEILNSHTYLELEKS